MWSCEKTCYLLPPRRLLPSPRRLCFHFSVCEQDYVNNIVAIFLTLGERLGNKEEPICSWSGFWLGGQIQDFFPLSLTWSHGMLALVQVCTLLIPFKFLNCSIFTMKPSVAYVHVLCFIVKWDFHKQLNAITATLLLHFQFSFKTCPLSGQVYLTLTLWQILCPTVKYCYWVNTAVIEEKCCFIQ